MSEQILKALMQLFAIIARPQSSRFDRRTVVENFLKRQINNELVQEYLKIFDEYYLIHQSKLDESNQNKKWTSSSSVRVLLICTELNEELTLKQKVILLVQLLEFVKSDISENSEITKQEHEFISTVAEIFKISDEEYPLIRDFVLFSSKHLIISPRIIIITSKTDLPSNKNRHIICEGLEGEVRVMHVLYANMFLIRYMSNSELYLNGQLLSNDKVYVFNTGSSLRNPQIKPIYYSDVVSYFNNEFNGSKLIFEVKNIEYQFKGGKKGLHPMSFREESGHMVGIMGSSGAGKTTLLNVLNGITVPAAGEVLINGINIHTESKQIEGIIGFVSQDDLLIEELTVFENLYYNARLCFGNIDDNQIKNMVSEVLQNLGLQDIKDMKVGSPLNKKISGGQRKRLNIGLELIREPSVLFLDEPTSGLSSRDSENIMDLLKELTFKGKLVFIVIHQPSSDIFKMLDKLLFLDTGGYLIYNGDPIDSIIYFKSKMHHANWNESECHVCGNVNPEQIFNIVESRVIDENGKITHTRKVSPKEWNQHFINFESNNGIKSNDPQELPYNHYKIPGVLKQFAVFVQRDVLSKLSNTQYLLINLLEAPVLAFILSYLIKFYNVTSQNKYTFNGNSNLPVYIFMSVIVAIFVGLSVSAEEIIKDRKILKREAFLNLSWASYLLSKIAVLFTISAIQALLFVVIGNSIIEIKGMYFHYWIVLFSAWAASNVVGLVISDSFKTVVTIYILIPFLVIPQIILSGVIVKFDRLNPALSEPHRIPVYGEIITARWAYEALAVYQFMENDYEKILYPYEKIMSLAEFKKHFWVGNLKNKTQSLSSQLGHPDDQSKFKSDVLTLQNEITKENLNNPLIKFSDVSKLTDTKLNPKLINDISNYLDDVNRYYIRLYNKANDLRDSIIRSFQKTPYDKEKFLDLKMSCFNDKLNEFVTNTNEVDRIVEYNHHLYQKVNPVYLEPDPGFIKAHFYAPVKPLFGRLLSTFWINVAVIFAMTLIAYLVLYFRLMKKLLDALEQLFDRFSKNTD